MATSPLPRPTPWGTLSISALFAAAVAVHAMWPAHPATLAGVAMASMAMVAAAYKGSALARVAVRWVQHARRATQEASNLHQSTIEALAMAIEAKDSASYAHLRDVQRLAGLLAAAVGMEEEDRRAVETAALLHDIGMLAVPPHIVVKTGRLSPEELQKVRIHPRLGADIIRHVPFPRPVAPLIESHHERWDGTGYPDGLAGEAIPLGARIIAIVDRFGALMADRPHRSARTKEEAVAMLRAEAGTGFDPALVATFIEKLPEFEAELGGLFRPAARTEPERGEEYAASQDGTMSTRVLEDIARANREFYELYQMSQALVSLSVNDTMALVASRITDLIPSSCCALFIEDDGRLVCRYARGLDADVIKTLSYGSGEGFIGRVHQSQRAAATGQPFEPGLHALQGQVSLRSAIAGPLLVDGRSLGVLWVAHTRANVFEDDHLRIIDAVARQAAGVLHNAMRFEQTRRDSITDPLTGLLNSRGLASQFESMQARALRTGEPLAVLVLDVDDLKSVNDTYGHAVGDLLLQEVARSLRSVLRPTDPCARWAGDEFAAVLGSCTRQDAERRALDLQATLATRPIAAAPGETWYVRVSAGIAAYPEDGVTLEALMARGDARMYDEKQAHKRAARGKVGVEVHSLSPDA